MRTIACNRPTRVERIDPDWGHVVAVYNGNCTRFPFHLGECIDRTQYVRPRSDSEVESSQSYSLFANHRGGLLVGISMLVTLIVAWVAFSAGAASAHQPYGGCDEAWQAPKSAGAKHCRTHGWLVRPRVVVGPKGWVHHNRLPACTSEDMIGCWWNGRLMGDGKGRSVVSVPTKDGSGYIRFVRTNSLPQVL